MVDLIERPTASVWGEEMGLAGPAFTFVDLFAGIGGFHGALSGLGGRCVWASEIDTACQAVYARNWGMAAAGDIVPLTDPTVSPEVPEHQVLTAGFPCQPFSKSGRQEGFRDTTRGTLFFNICQILEARRPAVILLENVRNLAGPRQTETWATIVRTLRDLGYRVSGSPTVFSPHLLPWELGGRPQVRDRVFVTGTRVGPERAWAEATDAPLLPLKPVGNWHPRDWDVTRILDDDATIPDLDRYRLTEKETRWVAAWDDFVRTLLEERDGARLPGFPIWADAFATEPAVEPGTPRWKADFLAKNSAFYLEHRATIDAWLERWDRLAGFPPSRQKLEWQAQDETSLWDCVLHLRPSGIRAKRATYLPALVAITQTSVYGPRRRRITPREAARLQGLPEWFSFGDQPDKETYKQLGNGVSMGAAQFVFRTHVERDAADLLRIAPEVVAAVRQAGCGLPRPELPLANAQMVLNLGV